MPVVEYKMHRVNGGPRRQVPDFIGDRGHHTSPIDGTLIGWVDANADYHVPDTLVSFTKEEFVQRQLTIHASHPFTSMAEPDAEPTVLTDAEVRTQAEAWYDDFVAKNDV